MNNDRLPPYDGEAEKAVLGSILIDDAAIYKITTSLDAGDFFILQNQEIYAACRALGDRSETINQITVAQELARDGKLEEVGGVCLQLEYINYFYANNGVSDTRCDVFLARGVEMGANQPEDSELIEIQVFPKDEVLHMARSGEITDGMSALSLFLCEPYL